MLCFLLSVCENGSIIPGTKDKENVPSKTRANVIREPCYEEKLSGTNLAVGYLVFSSMKGITYRAVHCL